MNRLRAIVALSAASVLTGGCVAAAIPVLAGGVIVGGKSNGRGENSPPPPEVSTRQEQTPQAAPVPASEAPLATEQARELMRAAERGTVVPSESVPASGGKPPSSAASPSASVDAPLATKQARDLMRAAEGGAVIPMESMTVPPGASPSAPTGAAGAGEAAAYSLQAYQALWTYVEAQVRARRSGQTPRSVVLAEGASLDAPRYVACGAKPLAIIFDLDENAEGSDPQARWRRWNGDGRDLVSAVPGAVEGIDAVRREGVQAIFTSARARSGAKGVSALLAQLDFGEAELGKTLFLRGGEPTIPGDQMRRTIAANHCVIAIVGDSLGEFSDAFDAEGNSARRPTAATETMVAPLWGAGWFLLPNPVRSTAIPSQDTPKE